MVRLPGRQRNPRRPGRVFPSPDAIQPRTPDWVDRARPHPAHTLPGHYEDYLADLCNVWRAFNDEAIERGVVKSYKILSAAAATPEDWNLILLVEHPNMATFDNASEKCDPIAESILGNLQEQGEATVERSRLRHIMGSKLARELHFN